MRELVFGPTPKVLPATLQTISPLMDAIGRSIRPRVVGIPQLTDAQIKALTMPLLAIVGGRDALLDSADTRDRLQRNMPQAEICFIEDGFHFLPDQTARVMTFLERNVSLQRN